MMKQKLFFPILAVLLMTMAGVQSAKAQKMIVVLDNDEVVSYKVKNVKCILFEEATSDDHEWVNLGLPSGTLWATCNIGADSPEDYGDYFAWGEKATKEGYSWGNYAWMTEGKADWLYINKYTFDDNQTDGCWYSGSTFIGDNKKKLDLADDAAFVLWGSKWQTPSKEQFEELINSAYTKSEWTAQNGVTGYKITSRSNGNTLFLPATGYIGSTGVSSTETSGNYWTRTLGTTYCDRAYEFFIRSQGAYCTISDRYVGQSIRPVRRGHDYVDLGLPSGTLWATCNVGAESPEEYGDYFAWGETEPKEVYYYDTYKWCKGTSQTMTKYCTRSNRGYNGFTDGKTELDPADDAATANWGALWQTPTKEQIEELIDNCTNEWTQLNGVNSILVTGPNGGQIFLPSAGYYRKDESQEADVAGSYWSSSRNDSDDDFYVYSLRFITYYLNSDDWSCANNDRFRGLPVRPVRKK